VFALHYLWPQQKTGEVITEVAKNGKVIGLLANRLTDRGFQPLCYLTAGWQWFTGNKWLKTPDDFVGLKHRVMASKILVEDYRAYGANPTTLDYTEIYSGLQTGLIESQVNTMKGCYEMKFWEVQDYFVNAFGENYIGIVVANRGFFETLPHLLRSLVAQIQDEIDSSCQRPILFISVRNNRKLSDRDFPNPNGESGNPSFIRD